MRDLAQVFTLVGAGRRLNTCVRVPLCGIQIPPCTIARDLIKPSVIRLIGPDQRKDVKDRSQLQLLLGTRHSLTGSRCYSAGG